jgi:ADP-ribose pyrophosphatase YjhB (NUDIX family)
MTNIDSQPKSSLIRCVLHGSFRKHFAEIGRVHQLFSAAGIEVLAPRPSEIAEIRDGFAYLKEDEATDPRHIELLYLHHLKKLGRNGFSYFVNPSGYLGTSASYELGIAQTTNVPCYFLEKPVDHPAYLPHGTVRSPEELVESIRKTGRLPAPRIHPKERLIHQLWTDLMVPGSVVAVGGVIEYLPRRGRQPREILLVKTHKWGGRYSIVGGKLRRNETLTDGYRREIQEETGLSARVGDHLATFDQIKKSGYYLPHVQHIFVDRVAQVETKRVRLNDEAQAAVWLPAHVALATLDIEPNARYIVEKYVQNFKQE